MNEIYQLLSEFYGNSLGQKFVRRRLVNDYADLIDEIRRGTREPTDLPPGFEFAPPIGSVTGEGDNLQTTQGHGFDQDWFDEMDRRLINAARSMRNSMDPKALKRFDTRRISGGYNPRI